MIDKQEILETLDLLDDKRYRIEHEQNSKLFLKLALMEYCGWIEKSLEKIVLLVDKHLRTPTFKKILEKDIVQRNNGFDYEKNFRPMMIKAIGLCSMEIVEDKIDGEKLEKFKSEIGKYRKLRNQVAHSHIQGITTVGFVGPSVIKKSLEEVSQTMNDIYLQVKERIKHQSQPNF